MVAEVVFGRDLGPALAGRDLAVPTCSYYGTAACNGIGPARV